MKTSFHIELACSQHLSRLDINLFPRSLPGLRHKLSGQISSVSSLPSSDLSPAIVFVQLGEMRKMAPESRPPSIPPSFLGHRLCLLACRLHLCARQKVGQSPQQQQLPSTHLPAYLPTSECCIGIAAAASDLNL